MLLLSFVLAVIEAAEDPKLGGGGAHVHTFMFCIINFISVSLST